MDRVGIIEAALRIELEAQLSYFVEAREGVATVDGAVDLRELAQAIEAALLDTCPT